MLHKTETEPQTKGIASYKTLDPLEIHSYKTLTGWGTMSLGVLHLQKAFRIQPNITIEILGMIN
jgi:hypothetical protein